MLISLWQVISPCLEDFLSMPIPLYFCSAFLYHGIHPWDDLCFCFHFLLSATHPFPGAGTLSVFPWLCPFSYWVGQKVHSGFSIPSYGEPEQIFGQPNTSVPAHRRRDELSLHGARCPAPCLALSRSTESLHSLPKTLCSHRGFLPLLSVNPGSRRVFCSLPKKPEKTSFLMAHNCLRFFQ